MANNHPPLENKESVKFQITPPEIIQTGCEECGLPLALYGFEAVESRVWNTDKTVTRFFCALHYLEFCETNKQRAKRAVEKQQGKMARFTKAGEVSK